MSDRNRMISDLWRCTATELSALIDAKEASPSEILASVLDRIDRFDRDLHAFVTRVDDLAIEEARRADDRALHGERISPMDGIPYSIKDLCQTAGIRTTMGSRFLSDNVPKEDSLTAARLRSSGGVLLGKTNSPHFGHKDTCDNLVAETTLNPWNLGRTSGGSSGGAAAGVAAGFGPLAQGGDGAGSIRIPAALCGVVGFKPSFGRVPLSPYAEFWSHCTHWGPIARTVSDAAMMLSVLAGPDERDAGSIDNRLEPFETFPDSDAPLSGIRIRWSPAMGYGAVDPEIEEIVRAAVDQLIVLGAGVHEAAPGWEDPAPWHRILWSTPFAAGLADAATMRPEWIEDTLQSLIDEGQSYSAVELRRAETSRGDLYTKSVQMFREVDFYVTPAMPLEAWSAQPGCGPMNIAGYELQSESVGRAYLLWPFNLTGQPAVSIPCGWTESGLPVGIQIVGRWHQDIPVLQVAEALERRLDLWHRMPLLT